MQIPIGAEQDFRGVVDLITGKAIYFEGDQGVKVRYDEVPVELVSEFEESRKAMLESLSMYSDELMELLLEERDVPEEMIHKVIKNATLSRQMTPVFMGTAYRKKVFSLCLTR